MPAHEQKRLQHPWIRERPSVLQLHYWWLFAYGKLYQAVKGNKN